MKNTTINYVFVALFAAIVSVSGLIAIPAGPLGVPIVIQNTMAIICGAVLGPVRGGAAVLIFLIAGALGLPVFAGGTGGFAKFLGPTGGFLVGYFLGAVLAGFVIGNPRLNEKKNILLKSVGVILGNVVIYVVGIARLAQVIMQTKIAEGASVTYFDMLPAAFAAGAVPFIPGFIIKTIIAVPLVIALRPIAARYLNSNK